MTPETGKPTYYFTKAAEADPDNADILFNLGYAYALDRDPQGAIYWLREALRRDPVDADAHVVLASALDAAGNGVEAVREREIAEQLSSRYGDGAPKRPPATAQPGTAGRGDGHDPLPRGLARIAQDLDSGTRVSSVGQAISDDDAARPAGRGAVPSRARPPAVPGRAGSRGDGRAAARGVPVALRGGGAPADRPDPPARAGRPREAVDALKISIWSQDTVAARVALGEAYLRIKDTANARAQAQKALALDPGSEDAKALLAEDRRIDEAAARELLE